MSLALRKENEAPRPGMKPSFAEVTNAPSGRLENSIQLQLGEGSLNWIEELTTFCLVGRWVDGIDCTVDVRELRKRGLREWGLRGALLVSYLVGGFCLMDFELKEEADRVP